MRPDGDSLSRGEETGGEVGGVEGVVSCWLVLMIFVVVCRSCQPLSPAPPAQPTGRGAIHQLGAYRPCDRRVESGQLLQNNINYCYLQHHHHPPNTHKLGSLTLFNAFYRETRNFNIDLAVILISSRYFSVHKLKKYELTLSHSGQ